MRSVANVLELLFVGTGTAEQDTSFKLLASVREIELLDAFKDMSDRDYAVTTIRNI